MCKQLGSLVLRSAIVDDINFENSLVSFKDHACGHLEVFVQIDPGAVSACLIVEAIGEDPFVLLS